MFAQKSKDTFDFVFQSSTRFIIEIIHRSLYSYIKKSIVLYSYFEHKIEIFQSSTDETFSGSKERAKKFDRRCILFKLSTESACRVTNSKEFHRLFQCASIVSWRCEPRSNFDRLKTTTAYKNFSIPLSLFYLSKGKKRIIAIRRKVTEVEEQRAREKKQERKKSRQ